MTVRCRASSGLFGGACVEEEGRGFPAHLFFWRSQRPTQSSIRRVYLCRVCRRRLGRSGRPVDMSRGASARESLGCGVWVVDE